MLKQIIRQRNTQCAIMTMMNTTISTVHAVTTARNTHRKLDTIFRNSVLSLDINESKSFFLMKISILQNSGSCSGSGSSKHYILETQCHMTWWRLDRVDSFQPEGCGFDSRSSRHVGTLGKSFTCS